MHKFKSMLKKLFKFGGDSDFGKLGNTAITIIGVTIIVFVWHLIAKYEIIPTKILPDPFKVIGSISGLITENDLLVITADHGCDPTVEGTDHTREYVPVLYYSQGIESKDLGLVLGFDSIANRIDNWLF